MQAYWAVVEGEADDYQATVPNVTGAVGAGETFGAALAGVCESLAVMLADLETRGEPLPSPSAREQVDVSDIEGTYQLVEVEPVELNPVSLAIERARRRRGWSQAELAQRMGAKRPLVSRLENPFYWGHSSETLRKVADAFDSDLELSFKPREGVRPYSAA